VPAGASRYSARWATSRRPAAPYRSLEYRGGRFPSITENTINFHRITQCINRAAGSRMDPRTCFLLARPYWLSLRVTDGARTRDLRSHNPPTPVSRYCLVLQKPLRQAGFCSRLTTVPEYCALSSVKSGVNWCNNIESLDPLPSSSRSVTKADEETMARSTWESRKNAPPLRWGLDNQGQYQSQIFSIHCRFIADSFRIHR
jgi:hypothetical protein